MFYQFDDELLSVDMADIDASSLAVGYIKSSEMDRAVEHFSLPKNTVSRCNSPFRYFHSDVEIYEDCFFATLGIINGSDNAVDSDRLAFYVKKNLLLIVDISDADGSVRDMFLRTANRFDPYAVGIESLTFAFLESVISGDGVFLESTQMYIDSLEKQVAQDGAGDDFNLILLNQKQLLLHMHNYYEQLLDIATTLGENENDIFSPDQLGYFDTIVGRINRLKENVALLRDSVVHLRDAYQSLLELRLNKTMKIFTVFTVIFSPLSFVAGWYGMNFHYMPELSSPYGYVGVIVACLLVVAGLVLWFRRKGWI